MRKEVVIDTSYLIILLKQKRIDALVRNYIPYLVDISLYEYLRGEYYIGRDIKKAKEYLEKIFNIIHLDNKIILKACEIWGDLAKKGELIPEPDILIGAACIVNDLPLLTLDSDDFKRLEEYGLKLEEPSTI
ncbi:MAG: type II toxin-antitoxin system VapC family toxin [Candidatus Njordarchaeales archaeon]